jgi:hypothetical protein
MTKPTYAEIGPVTQTADYEDTTATLVDDLEFALRGLLSRCRVPREERKRFTALLRDVGAYQERKRPIPGIVVVRLLGALDHFAPPHSRFDEQDGGWGYWLTAGTSPK